MTVQKQTVPIIIRCCLHWMLQDASRQLLRPV